MGYEKSGLWVIRSMGYEKYGLRRVSTVIKTPGEPSRENQTAITQKVYSVLKPDMYPTTALSTMQSNFFCQRKSTSCCPIPPLGIARRLYHARALSLCNNQRRVQFEHGSWRGAL